MYTAATAQSWWSEATERGQIPICFSRGYRPIEDQVYLRIKNGGHRNFAQVMSSPTSPPCSPPTAKPGRSRHNLGLAIDFGGLIGQSRQNGDSDHLYPGIESEACRWLTSKGLDGDGTYSLKRYSAEAWHWSVDGGYVKVNKCQNQKFMIIQDCLQRGSARLRPQPIKQINLALR